MSLEVLKLISAEEKSSMKKNRLLATIVLCLLIISMAVPSAASVSAESRTLYENFEDYTSTDYQQTLTWAKASAKATCQAGSPVAPGSTKSVQISTIISDESLNFWMRHGTDKVKQNWTGAKYVEIYIQNLTGSDHSLGFMITDVVDSNEKKQEHWQLVWEAAVVLKDMNGNMTKVLSDKGMAVTIPANFKGSIEIPLNTDTLEIPGWLYGEASYTFGNQKLDLDSIFKISPIIPEGEAGSKFLIDDIYWSTSSEVDNFLGGSTDGNTTKQNTNSTTTNTAVNSNVASVAAQSGSDNTVSVSSTTSADNSAQTYSNGTIDNNEADGTVSDQQTSGQTKSSKAPLVILIVIIMLVILGGGAFGVFWVMKKGKTDTDNK